MEPIFWIALIVLVVVAAAAWKLMIPSMNGVIAEAKDKGEVRPVVEQVERLRAAARPTAYNHAIRQLWDGYERELAVELVKELARRHSEAMISQYWIKQVMQVEPKLAGDRFSREFLEAYYQPEVASQCGPVG